VVAGNRNIIATPPVPDLDGAAVYCPAMQRPIHVLLVDDDRDLLEVMIHVLAREGFRVTTAEDGHAALERWRIERPDLVVLDVNLPGADGFEVCRQIRSESDTPVLLLTGRREEADVVRGLRVGADDYVTKPFSPKLLTARMAAVLRRYPRRVRPAGGGIQVGDLSLDPETHSAAKAGKSVVLTRLEFRLLEMLALNAGRVVPYARLLDYAAGRTGRRAGARGSATLRTHISHLRAKLGFGVDDPGGIRNVSGVGYMLARDESGTPAQLAR
jgi:two-component system, OmpR family, response regulator MtrA